MTLAGKRILLIVSGGIAAYKALELIRRLKEQGAAVRPVLTAGGSQFVTPLALAALCEDKVYTDLFSLTDEAEMGHIRLTREADLVVVAPASADLLAKLANGFADDLASTLLLASDKDLLVAPAMNHRMWSHPATVENLQRLTARGVLVVGPNEGAMACNEFGPGRLAEPDEILAAVAAYFGLAAQLAGRRALITSGPTYEAIDPVRYIANRSSGRQGHAVAEALARLGAETTLVTGPTALADPGGVSVVKVESARDMLAACQAALPVDVAVCAAAVADWRVAGKARHKIKKGDDGAPRFILERNPDILATLSAAGNQRPRLVIGFAAETENLIEGARAKRERKGCDWILANDVSEGSGTFGGAENLIHLIDDKGVEDWPRLTKQEVAERLARRIAEFFERAGAAA